MSDLRQSRALQEVGKRFVFRLSVLTRTAQIHSAENQAMEFSLRTAAGAATELVTMLGRVDVVGDGGVVHINGVRLRLDRAMITPVTDAFTWLRGRGVGGFSLQAPAEIEDLRRLLTALAAAQVIEGAHREDTANRLNSALGLSSPIHVLPPMELQAGTVGGGGWGEGLSVQVAASRAVYLYIRAVRAAEALAAQGAQEGIPRGVVRIVQQLVELVLEDPRSHMALIHLKEDVAYQLRHQVHTTILSLALGARLGLSRGALLDLGLSALTCNLGMHRLPPEVVNKAGPLTPEERDLVSRHPLESARVLLAARRPDVSLRRRLRVAFESNMGFDGTGYPERLGNWPQHVYSRIVAVTETYDALTTSTAWRSALLPDEALARLVEDAGLRLDPVLVASFINMVGRYPLGTMVFLSSGEAGVVYLSSNEPGAEARPVVRLLLDADGAPILRSVLVDLQEKAGDEYTRHIVRTANPKDLGIDVQRALFS